MGVPQIPLFTNNSNLSQVSVPLSGSTFTFPPLALDNPFADPVSLSQGIGQNLISMAGDLSKPFPPQFAGSVSGEFPSINNFSQAISPTPAPNPAQPPDPVPSPNPTQPPNPAPMTNGNSTDFSQLLSQLLPLLQQPNMAPPAQSQPAPPVPSQPAPAPDNNDSSGIKQLLQQILTGINAIQSGISNIHNSLATPQANPTPQASNTPGATANQKNNKTNNNNNYGGTTQNKTTQNKSNNTTNNQTNKK